MVLDVVLDLLLDRGLGGHDVVDGHVFEWPCGLDVLECRG